MSTKKTIEEGKTMKSTLEQSIFNLITEFEKSTGVTVERISVNKVIDPKTYKSTGVTREIELGVRI